MSEVDRADQARFDLTLVRVRPRTAPAALERLERRVADGNAQGKLLACLYSEIGIVNLILLLRRYDGISALLAAREALVADPDPLGVSEFALGMTTDVCAALPGLPRISAAVRGPLFEVRTDMPRPGRLAQALSHWTDAARDGVGPLPIAGLYSIVGEAARIFHIWPGTGLDERAMAPDAVSDPWPGADDLVGRRRDIFQAASFSPIG
jgi:hypothetical protein